MPTAKKLPSGSWRCQIFAGYEIKDGKKRKLQKSFTVKDPSRAGKKECEHLAAEWAAGRKKTTVKDIVGECVQKYIDAKEKVLSPSTIRGYLNYKKRMLDIEMYAPADLTPAILQSWIGSLVAEGLSSKYIRNIYGLLSAALSFSGAEVPAVSLPTAVQYRAHVPCDEDLKLLFNHLDKKKMTELKTAVILAAFCSLRRSEICAIDVKDIEGNKIRISKSRVRNPDLLYKTKPTPKTKASNRTVIVPEEVMKLISVPGKGRLVPLEPEQLTNRFRRAVRSCGVDVPFRFHDLRHYYASIAHALGIPDAYIMRMGGWETDQVMKRVYRDTISDREAEEQRKLTEHFDSLVT